MPVVERVIEAKHKDVKRVLAAPRHGPALASVGARLHQWQETLKKSPDALPAVVGQLRKCRHIRKVPGLLGFEQHPKVLTGCNQ
eukprot:11850021-Alexandrium_andersonii.AAC.1